MLNGYLPVCDLPFDINSKDKLLWSMMNYRVRCRVLKNIFWER